MKSYVTLHILSPKICKHEMLQGWTKSRKKQTNSRLKWINQNTSC